MRRRLAGDQQEAQRRGIGEAHPERRSQSWASEKMEEKSGVPQVKPSDTGGTDVFN